jgi:DNA-binding NtrC family response regulator
MAHLKSADFHILVIERPTEAESLLVMLLTTVGYQVTCMPDCLQAAAVIRTQRIHIAIVDVTPGDPIAEGLLVMMHKFFPDLPILGCLPQPTKEQRTYYKHLGLGEVFEKPVEPRSFLTGVETSLKNHFKPRHQIIASATALWAVVEKQLGEHSLGGLEQAPIWHGNSLPANKLNTNFALLKDFNTLALVESSLGLGALDVAMDIPRSPQTLMVACMAEWLSDAVLTELLAPAASNERPILLVVLESEMLDASQQALVKGLFNRVKGDALSELFVGRIRVLLFSAESLSARSERGLFSEELLIRSGPMIQQVPPLAQRRKDLWGMALHIWQRTGCTEIAIHPTCEAWILQHAWTGDYAQFHRTLELAGQLASQTQEVMNPLILEQAAKIEPTYEKPLFHERLMTEMAGPLVIWD